MAYVLSSYNREEWPIRLFRMRGFARVDVRYDATRDRMFVYLERHLGGPPDSIDLPEGYRAMTLEAFRSWVGGEVDKILGPTDFPTISLAPSNKQTRCTACNLLEPCSDDVCPNRKLLGIPAASTTWS